MKKKIDVYINGEYKYSSLNYRTCKEAIAYLTQYSCDAAEASTARWKKLGEYLMVKFLDGNVKQEENGKFKDNGYGLPDSPLFPGYSQEYYEEIVRQTGNRFLETPPKY